MTRLLACHLYQILHKTSNSAQGVWWEWAAHLLKLHWSVAPPAINALRKIHILYLFLPAKTYSSLPCNLPVSDKSLFIRFISPAMKDSDAPLFSGPSGSSQSPHLSLFCPLNALFVSLSLCSSVSNWFQFSFPTTGVKNTNLTSVLIIQYWYFLWNCDNCHFTQSCYSSVIL